MTCLFEIYNLRWCSTGIFQLRCYWCVPAIAGCDKYKCGAYFYESVLTCISCRSESHCRHRWNMEFVHVRHRISLPFSTIEHSNAEFGIWPSTVSVLSRMWNVHYDTVVTHSIHDMEFGILLPNFCCAMLALLWRAPVTCVPRCSAARTRREFFFD